ncbi:prolyl oligopeptidase family serine peptidase [Povalibacter sp.]|uniref:prolyl oligopeptidase family serine peptidase n=1 Tax=Povalibacter sp. TaxID=1962978 RepID=UPI002F4238CB
MKQTAMAACLLLPSLLSAEITAGHVATDPLAYPASRQSGQVDSYHGVRVADPYRWLENVGSPDVADWVAAQNKASQPFLEAIPAREKIKQRLTELWNYERYDVPQKRGGRYFFLRNDGLQNQSVLYVTESLDAQPRVLLDPNKFSGDATVALGEFVPSPDGKLLAYSLSDGGTDWRTWHVRDVATGKDLPDTLRYMKFREVAWTADSKSLYYARYPLRADGKGDDSKQTSIYRHRLGSTQESDPLVFAVTDHPTRSPYPQVSDDGRYLIIYLYDGSQKMGVFYQKLDAEASPSGPVVRLFDSFDADYDVVGEIDDVFFVLTTQGAPNSRLIAVPAESGGAAKARDVLAEKPTALLDAAVIGKRIVAQYIKDAHSLISVTDLSGKSLYDVALPGLGQASGFEGGLDDPETFFLYTDFLTPGSISRLDVATGKVDLFRAPKIAAQTDRYVTEQVFYKSKDGTRVPMFITHRRDLKKDGTAPLMLYGYGGFNIAQQPAFSVPTLVWLEMGGVFAVANLRGGSEYGEAWHEAGTRLQKQNVFDDFIAAAEWLIAGKYTSTPKLAIRGRSNGGLLVGAAMTQRPDLFGAALPGVGVLDMLRYHTASANARQWSTDYGLSEDAAEFQAQYAYSPVHNIKAGTCYPPTLITTADRDDRVVPWHSYKFAAALQHAQGCKNPVLLRVETRAGHGAGKPVWMQIEDWADQWAFLVHSLRMQ